MWEAPPGKRAAAPRKPRPDGHGSRSQTTRKRAPSVHPEEMAGLRICVGNAADDDLERALAMLSRLLSAERVAPLEAPVPV